MWSFAGFLENSSCYLCAGHMFDRDYIGKTSIVTSTSFSPLAHLHDSLQLDGIVQSRLDDPILGDRSVPSQTCRRSGRSVRKARTRVR